MGSHHGPAGEKRARTRWGLLSTEVSRHGGLPRGGLGPLPSLVAGGRRKSKICHHPPTANQASSQMGKPSLLTDQAIAIFPSTIPRPAGNITTHPRPVTENAVPAPPAPTPLIGTPAKTSWGGGENPGFRSTGLRPLQTPQAKRPDATTPVRIRKRGTQNERPLLRRFVSALDGLGGAVLSRRASSAPVSSFLSFLFHGMEILWE